MGLVQTAICWLRRDLRLDDHHALYRALTSGMQVQVLFIFDTQILSELPANDQRVSLIYKQLKEINRSLSATGSSLLVRHGDPAEVFAKLIEELSPAAVYTNEDYEPYARQRDEAVRRLLEKNGIDFRLLKDQVITQPGDVLKKDGKPYTVFTPWSRKWLTAFDIGNLPEYPSEAYLSNCAPSGYRFPGLPEFGFRKQSVDVNRALPSDDFLARYTDDRNFPAMEGTSGLSTALRFGLISIRKLVKRASSYPVYLNELGWREFYMMIIFHFPEVVNRSFKKQYDNIRWRNSEAEFERWKNGQTGYPIVDAGMRELASTGYMHNRVRMITASFLTKHLLIDWRWGEAWFAEKLLDFELSSNNGGWQWAAGTGCDAAPYFRVFNPSLQAAKFDPENRYIRKWVPEMDSNTYPRPMVEHKKARLRALETYKNALS